MPSKEKLLKWALAGFGAGFLFIYPMAIVWPAGWAWHEGPPHQSQYFMMIVGVYATLGLFLLKASTNPAEHKSLIQFTIVSSVVHGAIMAFQALESATHTAHIYGDAPALLLVAVVLTALTSGKGSRP